MGDFDYIETPEYVELQRPLAGIGTRFVAGLVDHLIMLVVALLLIIFGFIALGSPWGLFSGLGAWATAIFLIAVFLLYWGYFLFFEILLNGQTPGKRYVRIRVARRSGAAATAADLAVRNLLRVVDGLGVYAVAGICMFVTKRAQRLGDLAAGTVVVSEQQADYSARTDKRRHVTVQEEADAEALRTTGLSPEEYSALTNYMSRRAELTIDARWRILPQLLKPIMARRGISIENEGLPAMEMRLDSLMAGEEQTPETVLARLTPTEYAELLDYREGRYRMDFDDRQRTLRKLLARVLVNLGAKPRDLPLPELEALADELMARTDARGGPRTQPGEGER